MENIVTTDIEMLIKNGDRYTDIKLATGLIIDSNNYESRRNESTGVSTGTYGRYWFYVPKGKVIFKTYDDYLEEIQNCRMFNELLCYELAKQMGIRCAEYEPASLDGHISGVATYNVAQPNEKLVSNLDLFRELNKTSTQDLTSYWFVLDDLIDRGYKINKQKVMLDIYKIVVFDSLTMQSDRNSANVFFLINEETKELKVAPLIDNEFAFNLQNLSKNIKYDLYISKGKIEDTLDYIYKMCTVDDKVKDDSSFKENITNVIDLAHLDSKYGRVLKNFLKGFNVKKAINKLKKQGVELSHRYEEFLLSSEEVIKDLYREKLAEYQAKRERDMYFNPIPTNKHMEDLII